MSIKTESQYKGNVGLFLVAAELSRRNLVALPTSRNTMGYDLVILNPKNGKSLGVQVKGTDEKDFPIMQSYLGDAEEKLIIKIICPYIFVDITEPPKFFILSIENLLEIGQKIIWDYKYNTKHKQDLALMIALEKKRKKKQQWTVKQNIWLEPGPFKDNWEVILKEVR